jgi:hypothetical protein
MGVDGHAEAASPAACTYFTLFGEPTRRRNA